MITPVISVTNVSKKVAANSQLLTILDNISLTVEDGESIALLGVSGAGKSTLMALLAGLDIPTSGDIKLLGYALSELDDEARAALRSEHIGFVFQQFLLIPSLSAVENVVLPCLIRGEPEDTARALALLESVGLEHRAHHLPSQLSGGEQQRVAIARAFMTRPKVLFADEPTGNLDQQTAEKVIELLFSLNRDHGTTLILATHDQRLASRCDKRMRLNSGTLTREEI